MTGPLAWGIVGTGNIATQFAKALPQSRTGRLAAVASRSRESAEAFGERWNAPNRHASYGAMLDDETVQAVYVSTPHPMHAEWAVRFARAGKHLLCEKPLTMNRREAEDVVRAAREAGVFLMEAFAYRVHPQTRRLIELVRDGAVGEVRLVEAAYGFVSTLGPRSRLFDPALGGGGILDVGCYPVSMARLVIGAALGRPFADPTGVGAAGRIGTTGVDEWTAATLGFDAGLVAQVSTGVSLQLENVVRVFGTEGSLVVPRPWFVPAGEPGRILVRRAGEPEREETTAPTVSPYALEADAVAEHLSARESPEMSLQDSLGNMSALDAWRAAIGLEHPADRASLPS